MGARALAYIRVSVVGDRALRGRFESPSLQREAIDRWAEQHDVEVVDELRDLNRSGGTLTRPGLDQALERVKNGEVQGIIVARSDRASRRTVDGLNLIDTLEKLGGWIAAVDGTIDTTTRTARLATTMTFAIGQNELERYQEQSAEVHRRAILEKGRHMGPAPYGYRRDADGRLIPHPHETGIVRRVFRRRADGAGWVQLSRELEGERQGNGRRLNPHMLRRMVPRRVYLGEAKHGAHVKRGAHPAILEEGLWAAANRVVPAVASAPRVDRAHEESLLRGLLRCAGCRYVLKRLPGPRGARWACRSIVPERSGTHDCAAPARLRKLEGEEVERIVVERFMLLAEERAVARDEGDDGAERRLMEADALLDELSSLEVRRQLGQQRWTALVVQARADREAAAREAAKTRTGRTIEATTLREAWPDLATAERQELLRGIVQAVMVIAGNGPLTGRIHVVPVWEELEVPRRGSKHFVAREWLPG